MSEQSPISSNPLLSRPPAPRPTADTNTVTPSESKENAVIGPKGFPRPKIEVTYSPDAERHGPTGWTMLDGKDDNRHYIYERNTPTDLIRSKMRGFQVCKDKNITTGFDDKATDEPKVFGDLVLMETSRDHWDRLQKQADEDANGWKRPQKKQVDEMQISEITEAVKERFEAMDSPDGSGKKIWGFPGNPLGKK